MFLAGLGGLRAGLRCRVPRPLTVCLERARRRLGDAAVSDAHADVVRLQADDGGLADDVSADRHVVMRADRPAAETLDQLVAVLDARHAATVRSSPRPRAASPGCPPGHSVVASLLSPP